jgi:hypothetical protein
MIPTVVEKALANSDPIAGLLLSATEYFSLPLNRPRRLRRHVVDHAVDALHLVDDARRGAP